MPPHIGKNFKESCRHLLRAYLSRLDTSAVETRRSVSCAAMATNSTLMENKAFVQQTEVSWAIMWPGGGRSCRLMLNKGLWPITMNCVEVVNNNCPPWLPSKLCKIVATSETKRNITRCGARGGWSNGGWIKTFLCDNTHAAWIDPLFLFFVPRLIY